MVPFRAAGEARAAHPAELLRLLAPPAGQDVHSRALIASIAQAVFEAGPDGCVAHPSPSWCRFTGQRPDEAAGFGWLDAIHPDDRDALLRLRTAAMRARSDLDAELRLHRAAGGWSWSNVRAVPVLDADGRIVKWAGMTIDISGRRDAEERALMIADATNDVIWDFDIASGTITWSEALETRFGHRLDDHRADKRWWISHIHPEDRNRIVAAASAGLEGVGPDRWISEYRFRRADGSYADVLDRGHRIAGLDGKPKRVIGAMLDLTEKRRADAAMRVSEERFRLAVTSSGLGISDYDVRNDRLHWSDTLRAILGVGPDVPADQAYAHAMIHPDDQPAAAEHERRAQRGDFSHQYRGVWRVFRDNDGALRWISTQGNAIYDDAGRPVRVIVTVKDVTDEKTAQDRLHWTATHDAVTGLSNRSAFQAALDSALAAAVAHDRPLAVFMIDLDDFKQVNDTLGHHAGDLVLRTVSARVAEVLPVDAMLARFGGDEFAAILPGATPERARACAADLIARLRMPFAIDGSAVDLRASVGIAAFPDHGTDADVLLRNADIALYSAKDARRGGYCDYDPAMRHAIEQHAQMLDRARDIVDNAWAQPFYQPKIAYGSGRVIGLEALFRWRHPEGEMHCPASIAHAFDDRELAQVLGGAMIEAVLADVRRWLDARIPFGRVAINASAAEFQHGDYAARLLTRLDVHGVPAHALELEITETAFLDDRDSAVLNALETLRTAGMTIALDDFGTGFSSLSHLRRFPVDTLKIDRSFVSGIEERPDDRAIVEAVLRLGDALGLTTVAEGIETSHQALFLRSRGCRVAQGYLFSRPLPADAVPAFIESAEAGVGRLIRVRKRRPPPRLSRPRDFSPR